MDRDIYQELQERIDQYSVGMNASGTGKEIAILRRLFSEEEALVYLALSRRLEPVRSVAAKAGMSEKEAARILERMKEKGLVFPRTSRGEKYYAAAPFMPRLLRAPALPEGPGPGAPAAHRGLPHRRILPPDQDAPHHPHPLRAARPQEGAPL
jgi:hypothetical protein